MTPLIDLHIHSSFSEDGELSVNEICKLALQNGISAIAITDHDSVKSIPVARDIAPEYNIEHVPGVEVTTILPADGSQQHILGFYVDENNSQLLLALEQISAFRVEIAQERMKALSDAGFSVDEKAVWEMAAGRAPTAASIMKGVLGNSENRNDPRLFDYFQGSKKENQLPYFYREYLAENGEAYVPFRSIDVEEGLNVIRAAGGVPVLAHPVFAKKEEYLDAMVEMGIAGLEAVSTYHSKEQVEYYKKYALEHDLLVSAGSDFHGPVAKPKVKLGGIEGNTYDLLEKIKEYYKKATRK